ncbi:N-acetylmuramoyl-L-alanine amidase [Kribbella sp. NBC_01505]|uniref:peptidoglycan recognition protein family protein n=1 Tax=Kribbella sp. NBC_01505 TaxID=2903580 RepID=UPI003865A0BF
MAVPWLIDVLRGAGVQVVEEGNWRGRGVSGSFAPIGVLWHHTAATSSPSNPAPALNVCINGRPDLQGPLCHALVDYNGVFHLISANRANHAGRSGGSGPIPVGDGNTMLIGWEIDYNGVNQQMTAAQYNASVAATAAVLKQLGRDASYARGHRETSTTGKIDPSFINLDTMRADVARRMQGGGLSNLAVYRGSNSRFYIRKVDGSGLLTEVPFGGPGDLPATGRHENLSIDNLAVYRSSTATFSIRRADGTTLTIPFGEPGDLPASGHYEDGPLDNLAVFRPSDSTFYIRRGDNSQLAVPFPGAQAGDVPAIGRYQAIAYDNLALYRPSEGAFYIRWADGQVARIPFGNPNDLPAPGYFETTTLTNLAVYRRATSTFYIRRADNSISAVPFGDATVGDVPAVGKHQ